MAQAKKSPSYKERVDNTVNALKDQDSSLQDWAKKHNYSKWQVYGVTRLHTPPKRGTGRKIAEQLGLLGE